MGRLCPKSAYHSAPRGHCSEGRGMWREVGLFIRAFGGSWASAMSGAPSVPFAIWAVLSEGRQRIALACLAVLCVLVSSFIVWRREYRRAEAAEKRGAD